MTEEREIDVEELRAELTQIKDAMGIRERYEAATSIWLLFGLSVPLAAAASQYVHLERLPGWYHAVVWTVVMGGAVGLFFLATDRPDGGAWNSEGKPSLWVQFAVVYLATIPLQSVASAYAGDLAYVDESAMSLSLILVMLGVAYGVFGTSLKAYYVRRRDRWVFYAGTAWMIGLALAIPQSGLLETWAYAAFGGLYFAYAMVAYVLLRSGGAADG